MLEEYYAERGWVNGAGPGEQAKGIGHLYNRWRMIAIGQKTKGEGAIFPALLIFVARPCEGSRFTPSQGCDVALSAADGRKDSIASSGWRGVSSPLK